MPNGIQIQERNTRVALQPPHHHAQTPTNHVQNHIDSLRETSGPGGEEALARSRAQAADANACLLHLYRWPGDCMGRWASQLDAGCCKTPGTCRCRTPVIPSDSHSYYRPRVLFLRCAAVSNAGCGCTLCVRSAPRSVVLVRAREPRTEMKFISGGRTQAGANRGRKTLSVYGSGEPLRLAPWGVRMHTVCPSTSSSALVGDARRSARRHVVECILITGDQRHYVRFMADSRRTDSPTRRPTRTQAQQEWRTSYTSPCGSGDV